MNHPLEAMPPELRSRAFWALLALTLLLMILLNWAGLPLVTSAAPSGIVSFELAGSAGQAQAILDSWDTGARLHAAFSLGLDYLFMPVYSTAIGLACLWAARRLRQVSWPLAVLGAWLAWGLWLAALLDATENVSLLASLFGSPAPPWPQLAGLCASLKFGLILAGMVYTFYALAPYLAERIWRGPAAR